MRHRFPRRFPWIPANSNRFPRRFPRSTGSDSHVTTGSLKDPPWEYVWEFALVGERSDNDQGGDA